MMVGGTKRIYVMRTEKPTYDMRHDLYDMGVRWDSRRSRWWAPRLAVVRRAAELVGDAEVISAHVRHLPKQAATYRGGRPRAPRNGGKPKLASVARQSASAPSASPELPAIVPIGQPLVRQTANPERRAGPHDRRASDRRDASTRPDAVLVVPVALPELAGSISSN